MARGLIGLTFYLILVNLIANSLGTELDDANAKCKDLDAYDRFASESKPKSYYECNALHVANLIPCKYELTFDAATKSCTWSNDVSNTDKPTDDNCEGTPSSGTACASGKEVFDAMIDKCVPLGTYYCEKNEKIPDCSAEAFKDKYIADKGNCGGYYYCDKNGKRYKGECPKGYLFNPADQVCAHADALKCKEVVVSTGDNSVGDDWSQVCGSTKNSFIPDDRLCNAYIYCDAKGSPRQDFCPFGTYFVNGSCVKTAPSTCTCEIYFEEDDTAGTGTVAQQDKKLVFLWLALAIAFANSETTQEEYDERCAVLNPYDRIKNDDYCQKYIECKKDKTALIKDCPFGLAYDEDTASCIWKSDVDGCGGGTPIADPGCDAPSGETCTGSWDYMRNKCVEKGTYVCEDGKSIPKCSDPDRDYTGNFIADKENCAGYFYCDENNVRYKGTCESTYYFDPETQMCEYKDNPGLKDCEPVLKSPPSSSEPSDIDWDNVCEGKKNKFVVDPRLCNAYISCNADGKPTQNFCVAGKYFSNESCVTTKPSTCACETFLKADPTVTYEEYLPHTNEKKFYICTEGDRKVHECQGNSKYDPKSQSCAI
ncbi:unnamed protein product [Hermetia illucens]|uniref:Chitin-binding type-2 domain-containing protein n=1 Tax=Hermetia illucens TaxID=343691 RepID=A0A7R8YQK9_HERIL|nr:unnamed protein product [Hermetia illucens]